MLLINFNFILLNFLFNICMTELIDHESIFEDSSSDDNLNYEDD